MLTYIYTHVTYLHNILACHPGAASYAYNRKQAKRDTDLSISLHEQSKNIGAKMHLVQVRDRYVAYLPSLLLSLLLLLHSIEPGSCRYVAK